MYVLANFIKYLLQNVLYLWSFVKIALVASTVPCAAVIERTQLAVMPSHNRIAPSLDAVTYMEPVQEYLTYKSDREMIGITVAPIKVQ